MAVWHGWYCRYAEFMAKVDYRKLSPEHRQEHINLLLNTLEQCGLNAEGKEFLGDLLMESEVTMFARRIAIARLLLCGWSFEAICSHLHAGLHTVHAVDRWLSSKMYAYRSIVDASKRKRKAEPRDELFDLLTLRELRRRYPGRSALLNLVLDDHP